ncbi:hypothetical protein K1T71_003795 [Dendrolimus kikuchii]|uniref:Uncharacterized protein n=1 Tax=Dendrolimus kikuchii TaxID=765133 RepID=A0ACC1D9Q7_9NEOP|nr:hypothetical protein K1T71_003795 [Dendrolimus kikuchii]
MQNLPSRLVTVEEYDQNPPKRTTVAQNKTNKKAQLIHIATYNVRTLSTYDRLLELEEAIKEIKFDIIGISEVRRLGTKIEEYENFILCYIGHTPGKYGVGFIINKSYKNYIESFTGITERVAVLNINIQGYMVTIIQVYAPTEAASEYEIDEFYKTINKALETTHKNIILIGDFNAKVGVPKKEEHLVMKQYGYGQRNDRGQRLVDFALEHKLTILNTCFKKKQKSRWTWRSPNGEIKNEIDYILSNQPRIFHNIGTLNLNYPSDHRILRASILLTIQKFCRVKFTNKQVSQLNNEEDISNYIKNLSSLLFDTNVYQDNVSVQTCYDNITNAIRDGNKHNKILSVRTTTLLQRRKELQKTKNKSRSIKNELAAHYKLVNKYIKNDYKKYRQDIIERHLQLTGSTKKAFKELRINKTWIDGLKKTDKDTNKRTDIITTATNFYRKLYKDTNIPAIYQHNIIKHGFEENIEAGHITRLTDQRWTVKTTLWTGPQGKRGRGRPSMRWEEDIKKIAGPNWYQIAQDRDRWASLEEAFTQSGILT